MSGEQVLRTTGQLMAGKATGRIDLCSQWQTTTDSGFIRPHNQASGEESDLAMGPPPNSGGWTMGNSMPMTGGTGPSALLSVSAAAASRGLLDHDGESRFGQISHALTKQEPLVSSQLSTMLGHSASSQHYDYHRPHQNLLGMTSTSHSENHLLTRSTLNAFGYDEAATARKRSKHLIPPSSSVASNAGSLVLDVTKGELINLSKLTPQEILDAKALAASKNHSEAERRRRERINTHLATLRNNLPSSTKTTIASLLGEVIDHLKSLKRQAADISEDGPVPSDVDELTVDLDPSLSAVDEGRVYYRASICCDDRPDLYSDLMRTLHNLSLQTVKVDIATLDGRIKNVLLMTKSDEDYDEVDKEGPSVYSITEALRSVIERSVLGDQSPGSGSKRQRNVSLDSSSPSS
ncbi:hypothetical protein R1flu_003981 [Riccia fluitans]|uniref:BHLH domain-containing protein n=1 Tax=Riccia fluitans TaxID=41844 RepID=A0ABD1YS09_9MARC